MIDVVTKTQTEIEDEAKVLFISQFKGKNNYAQLVHGLASNALDIEETLGHIRDSLNIDTATGVALDLIGAEVGEARQSRADNIYRLWIKARILVNTSLGRPNDLIKIIQSLKTATEAWNALTPSQQDAVEFDIFFSNYYPAYYSVTVSGLELTADDIAALSEILQEADPAGVGMDFASGEELLFAFDGGPGTGFGDGILAEVAG